MFPIVYIRGYAGNQAGVEQTVDDPFYGFNTGSTHVRVGPEGRAHFYAFESPLLRLISDHGYSEVFEGEAQGIARVRSQDSPEKRQRTIWIHRYYDPTSETFDDSKKKERLEIEEAAQRLRDLIARIKRETGSQKVILVAHSMGGLICRSLLQKVYREHREKATDHVDKVFTYGTPHRGIHFEVAGGAVEWLRDQIGWNNSDDFGPRRMYQYLTPGAGGKDKPPDGFRSNSLGDAFPGDRFFSLVGTNARDYGMPRRFVGPQSDGLVQIDNAYVREGHRAYVHRAHSGRYGMVNSEEGYQNLQRFLFGDVKVSISLSDVAPERRRDTSYQGEVRFAIRGLPVLMHERTTDHYCPILLDEKRGEFRLATAFLIPRLSASDDQRTCRYGMRLAVQALTKRDGFLSFNDHLEQIPLWSDNLIVDLTPSPEGAGYEALYGWRSDKDEPETKLEMEVADGGSRGEIALPGGARRVLGSKARLLVKAAPWS